MITFYRLLGFLCPYKAALAVSWGLASIAMVMTVLLPYLTGQAVEKIHAGTSAKPLSPQGWSGSGSGERLIGAEGA